MTSLTANLDLAKLSPCDVLTIQRDDQRVHVPGDRLVCPEGHQLVCDNGRVWSRPS
jgi:hypothetical protein